MSSDPIATAAWLTMIGLLTPPAVVGVVGGVCWLCDRKAKNARTP